MLSYQVGDGHAGGGPAELSDVDRNRASHSPFAPESVTISDVETTVLVISGLLCPRFIGFIGSDGKRYQARSSRRYAKGKSTDRFFDRGQPAARQVR
jgi:hypothetical protein